MYKTKKVFDCQNMPGDTRTLFFEQSEMSNGCYVSHEVFSKTYMDEADDGTETEVECAEYSAIDAWLLENGATPGEYVLINHWW